MLARSWPILNKFIALARGPRRVADVAEREVVAEAEDTDARPILYLPGTLEKIRSASPHNTMEEEMEILHARTRRHDPVVRYRLKGGFAYKNGVSVPGASLLREGPLDLRELLGSRPLDLERALYCSSPVVRRYFFHWMMDACPLTHLAADGEAVILPRRPDWAHTEQYRALFGVVAEEHPTFVVSELTIYQDHSQGSTKRRRYAEIRKRVRGRIAPVAEPSAGVYLTRGSGGERRAILNEEALEARLRDRGFTVVDHSGKTADDIATLLHDVPVVVSIEGSQIAHCYYTMRADGLVMILNPADRFNLMQVGIAEAIGVAVSFVVMEGSGRDGYVVDLDELSATLDLAGV